jgi:hypothetical protein
MKRLSLVVALFALAIPAVASAKGDAGHRSAAKQCKAIRAEMGDEAFRAAFAKHSGKRAMKRCIAAQVKENKAAKRRAKKSCKAAGKRGRALKRCVRSKLEAEAPSAAPQAFKEAVEVCKDAREEDPDGFAEEYGEGAEAFEACIAVQTDEAEDEGSEGDDPAGEEPGEDEVADAPDPESELV